MDPSDGTDLAALHQSITDTMAAAFPGYRVEFYREDRKTLPTGDGTDPDKPKGYILLDLSEMERADSDPGTDQAEMVARFEAEVIVRGIKVDAKVTVRALAGSLAAYLRARSRWPGVLNGPIRLVGCYKDDFSPELDQFEVWRVEWLQEVRLGVSAWKATGTVPGNPLFSFVPYVGIPWEHAYQRLDGEPRE